MVTKGAKTATLSPPTGTGFVSGLGETFNMNLSTGQGMYTYKIPLPDGVAGHTPDLVLEYTHGAGLGAFGLGWRLSLRSISRRLDFGVPGENYPENCEDSSTEDAYAEGLTEAYTGNCTERFMDAGQEIMPLPDGTFAVCRETAFSRYTKIGEGWRIEERNGKVYELGISPAGRLYEPGHPDRVHEWLLERIYDTSGNTINYSYTYDGGIAYLSEIHYAIYALRFEYETRPDTRLDGRAGYLRSKSRRCTRIDLLLYPGSGEKRIRSWNITYSQAPGSGVSLLSSIQVTSYGTAPDGSRNIVRPPVTFQYTSFSIQNSRLNRMESPYGAPPPALSNPDTALVTLDNAPLPGVLHIKEGKQYYWRNLGNGTWASPRPVSRTPAVSSFAKSDLAFLDMDASGTADLLAASPRSLPGYYKNGGAEGWERFVAFPRGHRSAPFWNSGRIRLTDSNGDGCIDAMMSTEHSYALWLNNGQKGWSDYLLVPRESNGNQPDLSNPLVFLADMTGDGLDDLVRVNSGLVEYWPGLGYGRFGENQVMNSSPRLQGITPSPSQPRAHDIFLIDVDGDGCADLVRVSNKGVEVYLNQNGRGFTEPLQIHDVPPPLSGTIRTVNMRGSKETGLVWNIPGQQESRYVSLEFNSGEPAYLLSRIENGSGLVSEIFYRSSVEDYLRDREESIKWTTFFPFPYLVVAGTRETDMVSSQVSVVNYRYHEGHYNPDMRQFQGFRRTERIETGDESRPDTLTVFHFLMGQERLLGGKSDDAVLNGMLWRTEVYGLDGSHQKDLAYRVEESEYGYQVLHTAPDGQKHIFVFVKKHKVEDMERSDDLRGEVKSYAYDAFGNVIQEVLRGYGRRGGITQPERVRIHELSYTGSLSRYLHDKPARIVVRDNRGVILKEERNYYDGPDFEGLPLNQAERGLLTRKEQMVLTDLDFSEHYSGMNITELGYFPDTNIDGGRAFFVNSERHAYEVRGLKTADKNALGSITRYSYVASGLFRSELITSLGVTLYEYDSALGQPVRITYPDGAVVRFVYDAQGRILASALPGQEEDSSPATYSYNDDTVPNSRTGHMRKDPDSLEEALAITYFDGHGKEFQQCLQIEPGKYVSSGLRLLNPWGDLKEEYEPAFVDSPIFAQPEIAGKPKRQIFYDPMGRIVRTVNFNGGISTSEYLPFEVLIRDANDNDDSPENLARGQYNTPRREEFDVFRYRTHTIEEMGNGQFLSYTYETNPQGALLSITDDLGKTASYKYDCLGQRLSITQRESGERRMWYDGRGEVIRTLDSNSNDIQADIDEFRRLNRLTINGETAEEYIYDDPNRRAVGRLAEVNYSGGSQTFRYDEAGRLSVHEYLFNGLSAPQRLSYTYDALGRQIAVTHNNGSEAGLTINRVLTDNGWVRAVPGFAEEIRYNPRGLLEQITYANGVVTNNTFTPGPGRISSLTAIGPGGQLLDQSVFQYDRMEMLLSVNDTSPGGRGQRSFSYDPLYQLTNAATGEEPNSLMRRYDYAGKLNLSFFEEAACTLHYDDPLHPNRLSGLTREGIPRFDTATDENGNLLTLPGKTFEYNGKNELVSFTSNDGLKAKYAYDHRGIRINKTVTDSQGMMTQTFFLGDQIEIRNGQPAYFVGLGALQIAVVANGANRFIHGDYMGSTSFFTDEAGNKIASIAYHPFGNIASASGNVDYRTFGIHTYDSETGLYYMKRRYYSPEIGRFLTPDPLAVYRPEKYMHNPKGLHPYAFVANDPLNKTDTTGLSFWSVVGAIVGVIAAIAIAAVVVMSGGLAGVLIGAALAIGLVAVSYVVAGETAGTAFGEFMRGFLIGLNAGLNAILATLIFGPVVGIALGVINFLAAFDTIANSAVYQGILGWSSWLMPMSWLATGVGLIFFLLNVIPAIFTGNQVEAVRIESISIDWGTGTIVMEGGWLFLPGYHGGYNLGNFAYITPGSTVTSHETGHTLCVAAFGSIFHYIGAIDENAIQTEGANAYAERLADSHDPGGPADRSAAGEDPIIPIWV